MPYEGGRVSPGHRQRDPDVVNILGEVRDHVLQQRSKSINKQLNQTTLGRCLESETGFVGRENFLSVFRDMRAAIPYERYVFKPSASAHHTLGNTRKIKRHKQ